MGALLLVALLLVGLGRSASAVDWSRHADEDVVKIVTTDDDGSLRITKIWLVVIGGEAYVRAGSGRWGKNAERDPDVRLLTQEAEYDLRVEFLTDEAERAPVLQAFREKYGWSDRLLDVFRGATPKIMRLRPRPGGA
jgi:hypothetical protein